MDKSPLDTFDHLIVKDVWSETFYRCGLVGSDEPERLLRPLGCCEIHFSNNIWSVTDWSIANNFKRLGIGQFLFSSAIQDLSKKLGRPAEIRYNWNTQNEYVRDWLFKYFEPLEVPAKTPGVLIYRLNTDKVLYYSTERLNSASVEDIRKRFNDSKEIEYGGIAHE